MTRKLIKDESGYSLPELIVAILILTIALIPMFSMFDVGLRSASTSSNFDKARSLAIKQLERAKSLAYDDARDQFPGTSPHEEYDSTGSVTISDQTDPDPEYANFRFDVVKQYVAPEATGTDTMEFRDTDGLDSTGAVAEEERRMIRLTVTVRWGDGDAYTTDGIVAQ